MKKTLHFSVTIVMLMMAAIGFPSLVHAQWSARVNLSPHAVNAGLNESMGSCIGVSGDTVHVVWCDQRSGTRTVIYYIRSTDAGLTWNTPIAITDTNGNAWNPAIAVNGPNIHVVWRTVVGTTRSSHYRRSLDAGNNWQPNILLDSAVADWPAVTVSGNYVYVVNDILTASSPYNTEIFFLRSTDNGATWSAHQQVTFSVGRSEDEAIAAQGPDIYMAWNDNRNGTMQIFYKHSHDHGTTWDADVLINSEPSYGTMVNVDGAFVDIPSTGAPSGHYQTHLNQSADTGNTWGADHNLTNDAANTYYYPYMVRDGSDLHLTYVKSGVGGQYLHSGDGGTTWDAPLSTGFSGITPFVAYNQCVVHIIMPDSGHINYIRNPTGNHGTHCPLYTGIKDQPEKGFAVSVYPNPFGTQTTFEIDSPETSENCELRILDIMGREVINLNFGNNTRIIFDRGNLNSGIYLYSIVQSRTIVATGKMMVE